MPPIGEQPTQLVYHHASGPSYAVLFLIELLAPVPDKNSNEPEFVQLILDRLTLSLPCSQHRYPKIAASSGS